MVICVKNGGKMGTGNFYKKNADAYYVIGNQAEEVENGYEDEYLLEYELENIRNVFEEKIKAISNKLRIENPEKWLVFDYDPDTKISKYCTNWRVQRNFSATVICTIFYTFKWNNCEQMLETLIVARSGYYSHANLDFEMMITPMYDYLSDSFNFEDWQDEDELPFVERLFLEAILDCEDELNEQGVNIKNKENEYRADLYNKIYDESYWLAGEINKIFSEASETYNIFARFSNGETMYSKAA